MSLGVGDALNDRRHIERFRPEGAPALPRQLQDRRDQAFHLGDGGADEAERLGHVAVDLLSFGMLLQRRPDLVPDGFQLAGEAHDVDEGRTQVVADDIGVALNLLVRLPQLCLGLALLGDVGVNTDPLADVTGRVKNRLPPNCVAAPGAIAGPHAMLEQKGSPFSHSGVPGIDRRLSVVRVNSVGPTVALVLVAGLPGDRGPARLFAGHPTLSIIRPHDAAYSSHSRSKALLLAPHRGEEPGIVDADGGLSCQTAQQLLGTLAEHPRLRMTEEQAADHLAGAGHHWRG